MSNMSTTAFVWDADKIVEDLLRKSDETVMPLPSFESEPHLLMSKIKEIKTDTKKRKLNKGLYDCLQKPHDSEKKTQTTIGMSTTCTCQCICNGRRKRRLSQSPTNNEQFNNIPKVPDLKNISNNKNIEDQYKIPTVINNQIDPPQVVPLMKRQNVSSNNNIQQAPSNNHNQDIRMSIESHDSAEDLVMLQLEQLFRTDSNDDDLFEGTLREVDTSNCELTQTNQHGVIQTHDNDKQVITSMKNDLADEQAYKIKSLDERLALLESSGILAGNQTNKVKTQTKPVKQFHTHWLCEMYFQKVKLFETLDEIRDYNRKKYARIKNNFTVLFGEDSDDEQVLSPLEETPEFVLSCKERIAPWIIKILSPHYVKGRIRGKMLFKSVARHLIRLIYQCSRYPKQSEGSDMEQECSDDEQELIISTSNREYYIGKDKSTKWSVQPLRTNVRTRSENIILQKPGVKPIAQNDKT
ncbi:hypothetical protein EVAR_32409_1 [Eumeta japonica]|uniref:Set2 Rpb1 interacting domain-containing protein n=1 Tax=Eumeta variegata TaxID=151549 RepID=A0A4C1VJX2_EUMVA|nr:hypothetical protein EVAR_32409_1 [Eumeta japonica]